MSPGSTGHALEPAERYRSIGSLQQDLSRCRRCSSWCTEELRLLSPTLVLPIGALAARAIVRAQTLAACVGKSYIVDDAIVIPLPHPAGASAWLNDSANRRCLGKPLTHPRREIARLDQPRRTRVRSESLKPVCEDALVATTFDRGSVDA